MNSDALAKSPSQTVFVHTSNSQIGGAEISLLAAVSDYISVRSDTPFQSKKPVFIFPTAGPFSKAVVGRGWEARFLAWPKGLAAVTQTKWYVVFLILPGIFAYQCRLFLLIKNADKVWSSGVKSHGALILLAPLLRSRIIFDIRDFLRPLALRRAIAWVSARFGCSVVANSRAVGRDFLGAFIRYPIVKLPRRLVVPRRQSGKRIVSHLAYFAPYKGQDLFLACARTLLDAGVDAEFWIIGDVIYSAPDYASFREKVYALSDALGLSEHVRFLGKVEDAESVQQLLEQTDVLLHCTREPEPYGRAVMEALLCGAEAICHRGSGVVEETEIQNGFSDWLSPLQNILGPEFVQLKLKARQGTAPQVK